MTGPVRREKRSPKYPWVIPTIVVVAIVIVIGGIVFAVSNGIRMF